MKNYTILAAFLVICACISCRKHSDPPPEPPTYFGRDTTVDYLTWQHIDAIYPNKDSVILASHALSDRTLLLATESGISYFNTITNRVDSFVALKKNIQRYPNVLMSKHFTVYMDVNGIYLYDNKNLAADPIVFTADKSMYWPQFVITKDKLFYEHSITRGTGTTGILTLKEIQLDMDTTANSSKYINGYTEKEIRLPLDTFMIVGAVLNVMKVFDSTIYLSYYNHFYRVGADGNYDRIKVNGLDIYPGSIYKTNEALVLLSNERKVFYDHPLFYSADGKTWTQSFSRDFSTGEMSIGVPFTLENQPYFSAGWGNIYRISFSGDSFSMKYIETGNRHVLNISALYPSSEKYIYAVTTSGIYMINKSFFSEN